jgi:iron-sulfur cluster repair protein YtfE (RIC family)
MTKAAEVFKKYGIDYVGRTSELSRQPAKRNLILPNFELKLNHLDEVETNRQLNYKDESWFLMRLHRQRIPQQGYRVLLN